MESYTAACRAVFADQEGTIEPCCVRPTGSEKFYFCNTCRTDMCVACYVIHKTKNSTKKHDDFKFVCAECFSLDNDLVERYKYVVSCSACSESPATSPLCLKCQEDCHNVRGARSLRHAFADVNFDSLLLCPVIGKTVTAANNPKSPAAALPEPNKNLHCEMKLTEAEQLKLNLVRGRSLLEEFAQPLVVSVLEMEWTFNPSNTNYCIHCGSHHSFDRIDGGCVTAYLNESKIHIGAGVRKTVNQCVQKAVFGENKSSKEVFCHRFDLAQLVDLLLSFAAANRPYPAQFYDGDQIGNLCTYRHWCAHTNTLLDIEQYNIMVKEIPIICRDFVKKIKKVDKNYLPPFDLAAKFDSCVSTLSRAELNEKFDAQLRRYTLRGICSGVSKMVTSQSVEEIGNTSLMFATSLCTDEIFKFLVIPKFSPTIFTDSKQLEELRENMLFLTKLPWAAILDLNSPKLWIDFSEFGQFQVVEKIIRLTGGNQPSLLKTFGVEQTLYTSNANEFNRIKSEVDGNFLVAVVGFGGIDYSPKALKDLQSKLELIRERNYEEFDLAQMKVKPLVDSTEFLVQTNCLWEKHDDITEANHDLLLSKICNINHIAALVCARMLKDEVLLLPGNDLTRKDSCGFPVASLAPYGNKLEILHQYCDVLPLYVPAETIERDGVDSQSVIDCEVRNFLRGEKASWYLFQHNKVVKRDLLSVLQKAIEKDHKESVAIIHEFTTGATTLARHLLYNLRNSKVCVVVKKNISPADFEGLAEVFQKLRKATDLKLLVLLDFDDPLERFYNYLKLNCRFCVVVRISHDKSLVSVSNARGSKEMNRVLEMELSKEELDAFSDLIVKSNDTNRRVFLGKHNLSHFVTQTNFLDLVKIRRSDYFKQICRSSYEDLTSWGFLPEEIYSLQGEGTYDRDCNASLPLIGVLGFMTGLEFEARMNGILSSIVAEVMKANRAEYELLKLLVFIALFTPSTKLTRQVGSFVLHNHKHESAAAPLSAKLRILVSIEGRFPDEYLCIRTSAFTNAIAPMVFGRCYHQKGYMSLRRYLQDDFLPFLQGEHLIVLAMQDVILGAFCYFQIWHGSVKPTTQHNRYSFLVEMLFRLEKHDVVKETFNELLRIVGRSLSSEYVTAITSHAARYITDQAYMSRLWLSFPGTKAILNEALALLNTCDNSYTVEDRLGSVYKTEMRLLYFFYGRPCSAAKKVNSASSVPVAVAFPSIPSLPSVSNNHLPHSRFGVLGKDSDDDDADTDSLDGYDANALIDEYYNEAEEDADISAEVDATQSNISFSDSGRSPLSPASVGAGSKIWESNQCKSQILELIDIGKAADAHYRSAMKLSAHAVPNPMVGLAQTWDKFLSILVKFVFDDTINSKDNLCRRVYKKIRQSASINLNNVNKASERDLLSVLTVVNEMNLFDACFQLLLEAQQCLFNKNQRGSLSSMVIFMKYRHEDTKRTDRLILSLQCKLDRFMDSASKDLRQLPWPVEFDLAYARRCVLVAQISSLSIYDKPNCDQRVFSMLSLLHTLHQPGNVDLSIMELLFDACCALTPLPQHEVQSSLDFLLAATTPEVAVQAKQKDKNTTAASASAAGTSSNVVGLQEAWRAQALQKYVEIWLADVNAHKSRQIGAHICQVALFLWRVVVNGEKEHMSELSNSLHQMQEKSIAESSHRKYFLAKQAKVPYLPFTAFYCGFDLQCHNAAKLAGEGLDRDAAIVAQERIYALYAAKDLYVCKGRCGFRQSAKGYVDYFVVCEELDKREVKCSNWTFFKCKERDLVSFVLRLRGDGLWAHGIQKQVEPLCTVQFPN